MEQLAITLAIVCIISAGIYIYTFTPSGKRWTGEVDDVQE